VQQSKLVGIQEILLLNIRIRLAYKYTQFNIAAALANNVGYPSKLPIQIPTFQPSSCTAATKLTECPSFQSSRSPTQVPTKIRVINLEKSTSNDGVNVAVITGVSIGGGLTVLGVVVLVIYLWAHRKVNKPAAAKVYVENSDKELEGNPTGDVEEGDIALYDVMDINIELSDDYEGIGTNSNDYIAIESKQPLEEEKDSTINTITVKDSHIVDHWFVMDSDNDDDEYG
jgi:hypothetical protein